MFRIAQSLSMIGLTLLLCGPSLTIGGCQKDDDPLTYEEASEAAALTVASTSAEMLMDGVVEITTSFTIAQGVDQSLENLRDFFASQMPCSTVTLENATLTIDFGGLQDGCTWRGRTYAGKVSVRLDLPGDGTAILTHTWVDITQGIVVLNGGASVVWDFNVGSRRVTHDIAWTYNNRSFTGSGDRTWRLLGDSLADGLEVDGERRWSVDGSEWTLTIDSVRLRLDEAIPHSGRYELFAPSGRSIRLTFERLDEATIRATFESGGRSFSFDIKKAGTVEG